MLWNRSFIVVLICCVTMRENLPPLLTSLFWACSTAIRVSFDDELPSRAVPCAPNGASPVLARDESAPKESPGRSDELPVAAEFNEDPEAEEMLHPGERVSRVEFESHGQPGEVRGISFASSISFHAFKHLRI